MTSNVCLIIGIVLGMLLGTARRAHIDKCRMPMIYMKIASDRSICYQMYPVYARSA